MLQVLRPTAVVRVTEHIDEIVEYINRILGNGFAYRRDSGVYFDVARMGSRYGRLSGHSVHSVTGEGALLASDQGDKRRPEDFALWKAAKAGEPSWPSPFGPGRPGWHIECSAMSHAIFGDSLDLHSGGIDLKFPHHENEIAQCEAFSCCSPTSLHSSEKSSDWCRHWLHTGHLHIDGRKMSKSLKNFITVKEMLAEGVHAEDFRFFCLMHRYRAPTTYTASRLSEASLMRSSLRRALRVAADAVEHRSNRTSQRRWGAREHELLRYQIRARKRVLEALANDFDTPRALELLREAASVCTTYVEESVDCLIPEPLQATTSFIVDMLDLFGLGETAALEKKGGHIADPSSTGAVCSTSELVDCIANFRHQIRCAALASKKGGGDDLADSLLSSCDEMRSRSLPALGISLEDVAHDPRGYRWLHLDERIAQPGPTLSDADGARSLKKRREEEERIFLGTPADELFRDSDLYSQWDPSGFPTHDVDGAELSKSRRKKLLKVRDKHARLTQNKI
jgi:cysteinyl-tRNA synthetase